MPSNMARRDQRPTGAVRQTRHDPSDGDQEGQIPAANAALAKPRQSDSAAEDAPPLRRGRRRTGLELLLEHSRSSVAADDVRPAAEPGGRPGKLMAASILTSLGMGPHEAGALLEAVAAADGVHVPAAQVQHVCNWLTSAGLAVGQLANVLRAHPEALAAQPHRDWLPKVSTVWLGEVLLPNNAPNGNTLSKGLLMHHASSQWSWRMLCIPHATAMQVEFLEQLGLTIPQIERMTRRHPPWLVRGPASICLSLVTCGSTLVSASQVHFCRYLRTAALPVRMQQMCLLH